MSSRWWLGDPTVALLAFHILCPEVFWDDIVLGVPTRHRPPGARTCFPKTTSENTDSSRSSRTGFFALLRTASAERRAANTHAPVERVPPQTRCRSHCVPGTRQASLLAGRREVPSNPSKGVRPQGTLWPSFELPEGSVQGTLWQSRLGVTNGVSSQLDRASMRCWIISAARPKTRGGWSSS